MRREVLHFERQDYRRMQDRVAVEEPLEIRLGDRPLAVTMRTPGNDEDLAAGFCLTEGIVGSPDDLESVQPCSASESGNVVEVSLTPRAMRAQSERITRAQRQLYVSSSCGLCGKESIDRIEQVIPPLASGPAVQVDTLMELPERMRSSQDVFAQTGGLHAAGLFDLRGNLRVLREDVGRHNAVDKVLGRELLLGGVPLGEAILLVSGRLSFEIVQKAAMGGVALVGAVSAPSSLAVDLAARIGMTLVGFLRPGRMNIYHDAGRLRGLPGHDHT